MLWDVKGQLRHQETSINLSNYILHMSGCQKQGLSNLADCPLSRFGWYLINGDFFLSADCKWQQHSAHLSRFSTNRYIHHWSSWFLYGGLRRLDVSLPSGKILIQCNLLNSELVIQKFCLTRQRNCFCQPNFNTLMSHNSNSAQIEQNLVVPELRIKWSATQPNMCLLNSV